MKKDRIRGFKFTSLASGKAYLAKLAEGKLSVEEIEAEFPIKPDPEKAARLANKYGKAGITIKDAENKDAQPISVIVEGEEEPKIVVPGEEDEEPVVEKTFEEKIADGGDVVLDNDLELASVLKVKKDVNLDLNGKQLSIAAGNSHVISIMSNAKLSISNGKIVPAKRAISITSGELTIGEGVEITSPDVAIEASGANSKVIINGGLITSQESGVLVLSGAKLEINGGKLVGLDNGPVMGNGTAGKGDIEIVMNGGELEGNIQSAGYVAVGVYMPNSGSFTMNGGKITANGGAGLVARGGVSTINSGEIIATAHPTLEVGKVGDSRQVVPCSAIVYDKNSKYPAMDSLQIVVENGVALSGAHSDIEIISDEEQPNVIDKRVA